MRGANMSVVGGMVVKRFPTRITSESALSDTFVVRFQMFVQIRLRLKPFVAAGAFVRFLPSVDSLMSY